jgi:FkbM family methyltransferase
METTLTSSPIALYKQYLNYVCPLVCLDSLPRLIADLEAIAWEDPQSALDLNNFAVISLIEAEQCQEPELRTIQLEMALTALQQGISQGSHPLCLAHLALVHCLLGELQEATQIAFTACIETAHPAFTADPLPLGLVYIPVDWQRGSIAPQEPMDALLQAKDGHEQAIRLLAEVLCRSQLAFYNVNGIRFLELASHLMPQAASLQFKLGLAYCKQQRWEGLLYLHQARKLAPKSATVLQALYVAYQTLGQPEIAVAWLKQVQQSARSLTPPWQWTELSEKSAWTYVPLETDLLLAIEPRFYSIVTTVLLGEGDWFEAEMEFWRQQIKPGMTVIDVGANVGVYTFSAAKRVGPAGRVVAIEPFSACVRYLQETCRLNQLPWVKVCAGAASDRTGKARLALSNASELNEVVTDDSDSTESTAYEEIECFRLDDWIEQEQLTRVDWLKIDAEGHEIQVLQGSEHLIAQFAPGILYENIAASQGSNVPVAEWLQSRGYQLFRYQPYLRNLIPIDSIQSLQGNLNIIALPSKHYLIE